MSEKSQLPVALIGAIVMVSGALLPWAFAYPFQTLGAGGSAFQTAQAGHRSSETDLISVSISPTDPSILSEGSQSLNAAITTNGDAFTSFGYKWSMSSPQSGYLSTNSGSETVFTSYHVSDTTSVLISIYVWGYDLSKANIPVSATASTGITISSQLTASGLTISPNPVPPGTKVDLSLLINGGLPSFTVAFACGDGTLVTTHIAADGSASIEHIYEQGTYVPSATATDGFGESSSVSAGTTLIVTNSLAASISAPRYVDLGQPLSLTASVKGGYPPYSYSWMSSDGQSSMGAASWTLVAASQGNLGISLTVTDSLNDVFTAQSTTITVNPEPVLSIGSRSPVVDTGSTFPIYFVISGGTAPFSLSWTDSYEGAAFASTFPADGTFSAPFTFAKAGSIVISATLTDSEGASIGTSNMVGEVVPPPQVTMSLSPSSPTVNTEIILSGAVSAGSPPYHYSFSFSQPVKSTSAVSGNLSAPGLISWEGQIASAELVFAELEITDSSGGTDMATITVPVAGNLLGAISIAPHMGEVDRPLTSQISAAGGTPPYTYSVAGSDGESISGILPSAGVRSEVLVPELSGTLSFSLSLSDSEGRTTIATTTVHVAPHIGAYLSWSPSMIDAGQPLTVTVQPYGGWAPYSGVLSTSAGANYFLAGLTGATNLTLSFPAKGFYALTVSLTDSMGAETNRTSTVVVTEYPTVTLNLSATRTEVGVPVTFSISAAGGDPPFTGKISFGDGASQNGTAALHTYTRAGTYASNASMTDGCGALAHSTTVDVVVVPDPQALSTVAVPYGDVGHGVAFDSEVTYGTPPYSYSWGFGDGQSSAASNPSHVYTNAGLYHVSLKVTDSLEVSFVSPELNMTVVEPPVLSVDSNKASGDVGQQLLFQADEIGGAPAMTVVWNLGDGSEAAGFGASHSFSSPGRYDVSATLTDLTGTQATSSMVITVGPTLMATPVSVNYVQGEVGVVSSFRELPLGGLPPFTETWALGNERASGVDLSNWSLMPSSPGYLSGTVNITDVTGSTVDTSFSLYANQAIGLNVSASEAVGEVGQPIVLRSLVHSGVGPFTFTYDLPTGSVSGENLTQISFNPTQSGRLYVSVTVRDALGRSAFGLISVPIYPELRMIFPIEGVFADAGSVFHVPVTVSGGTGVVTVTAIGPSGVAANGTSITFESPGTYPIVVSATDGNGVEVSGGMNVSVSQPLSVSFREARAMAAIGVPTPFSVTWEGGHGPFTTMWTVAGTGSLEGSSVNLSFTQQGRYEIIASVKDAVGTTITLALNVTAVSDVTGVKVTATALSGLVPFAPTVIVNTTGGISPVDFSLFLNGQAFANVTGWQAEKEWMGDPIFMDPGSYQVRVVSSDGIGAAANGNLTLIACSALPPPSLAQPEPTAVAGIPLLLSVGPVSMVCPGANLVESWWGNDLQSHSGNEVTFLSNRSGSFVDHVSTLLALPGGKVLQNLTVPVIITVISGKATEARLSSSMPVGTAGSNLTITFLAKDPFGNTNLTANGSIEITPRDGGASLTSYFHQGSATFQLKDTHAGIEEFSVSSMMDVSPFLNVSWIPDGESVLVKLLSWTSVQSNLYLNVSVTDIYGNPLSNVSIGISVPGHEEIHANVTNGFASVVIPGAADASSVTLTGPGGAVTTISFGGKGSDSPSMALPAYLGLTIAVALVIAFLLWRRARGGGKEDASASRTAAEVMSDLIEKWPGEDRESLLAMAEKVKVKRKEGEEALVKLEGEKTAIRLTDEDGIERWKIQPREEKK